MTSKKNHDAFTKRASLNLSDDLMEAMLLLDPPNFKHSESSSELSLHNVRKAYDLLLDTSEMMNNDLFCNINNDVKEIDGDGDADEVWGGVDHGNVLFYDNISQTADLYRAIILSSTLILETCYNDPQQLIDMDTATSDTKKEHQRITNNNEDHNILYSYSNNRALLSQSHVISLCRTIKRSILLLQRLSHIVYLATISIEVEINEQNKNFAILFKSDNMDWHDQLLPKSQYPLLQECFDRKDMLDIETGIVFGKEDRLISLNIDDYEYWNFYYDCNETNNNHIDYDDQCQQQRQKSTHDNDCRMEENNMSNIDNVHKDQDNVATFINQDSHQFTDPPNVDGDDHATIDQLQIMSLNPKEIAKEEQMLLNIAFPDTATTITETTSTTRNTSKNCKNHTSKLSQFLQNTKRSRILLHVRHTTRSCSEYSNKPAILKYISLPFAPYGITYPILKQGNLIISDLDDDDHHQRQFPSSLFQSNSNEKEIKCKVRLYANGVLILSHHSYGGDVCDNEKNCLSLSPSSKHNDNIVLCVINTESKKCSSIIQSNTFHFQLNDVTVFKPELTVNQSNHHDNRNDSVGLLVGEGGDVTQSSRLGKNNNGEQSKENFRTRNKKFSQHRQSIKFTIDKEEGGNFLMEGWKWISTLDSCIEMKTSGKSAYYLTAHEP
mmetsp:Transcript_18943/g.23298  ORF Transcript_18943/g.23298 Transcript_18943/m.23298 type:complete len:665 (+) Transcript_18943:20-2014(+)